MGLPQDAGQGIEQDHIRLGGTGVVANDLELDVIADESAQFGDHVGGAPPAKGSPTGDPFALLGREFGSEFTRL